ncbi:LIC_10190 family membrane protein [Cystobacter ferrugineus]|uniref:DUF8201 domain-containing protein n=1 Tax=Cystobacter ferrugineus TaxID=83449 RepID=A0A1L9BCL7_9BACT|nr:hypothetical protein [Cystobacter ferrugineus]OJH39968.1 hypothetical protein BON30_12880 [Cystobacter ferrugineus]
MFSSLALILCSWLVAAGGFVGLGALTWRLMGGQWPEVNGRAPLFFTGWATALAFLQLWHFARPVDVLATMCLAGGGALGLGLWFRSGKVRLRRPGPGDFVHFGFVTVASVLTANLALSNATHADMGAYFVSSLRWAQEYRLPPGLGNFSFLLALNQSYFLYVAALDVGPLHAHGHHLANGLLGLGLMWRIARGLVRHVLAAEAPGFAQTAGALMLPAVFESTRTLNVAGPIADLSVFLVGCQLVLLWSELWESRERRDSERRTLLRALVFIGAAGIAMKSSLLCVAVPLGLAAVLGNVPWSRAQWRTSALESGKQWAIGLVVLLPWMLRGVVLSGYPLFPSPLLSLPVAWRMAPEKVQEIESYIKAFARNPNRPPEEVLSNWDWLWPWASQLWLFNWEFLLPVGLTVLSLPFALLRWRGGGRFDGTRERLVLFAPLLVGLLLWFHLAPDIRFAGALMWGVAAFCVAMALRTGKRITLPERTAVALASTALLAGALVLHPVPPWIARDGFEPLAESDTRTRVTRHGLEVKVPNGPRCFEALCTPQFDERLRLRVPGDWASGFVVE